MDQPSTPDHRHRRPESGRLPDQQGERAQRPTSHTAGAADSLQEQEITAKLIRGAVELEPTAHGLLPHRLPAWARAQSGQSGPGPVGSGPRGTGQEAGVDPQVAMAEAQPSGVRLMMRTEATVLELDTLRTRMGYLGAPPRPEGVYDLLVDQVPFGAASVTGGNTLELDLSTGTSQTLPGPVGTVRFTGLPPRMKEVQLWLPHNEITELVALRTDAPVTAVTDDERRTWVHHGSSISHGSNAETPTRTWPAIAAGLGGVELTNLGFGGSAMLDPFAARVIADLPADVISIKIGINLVNLDAMRMRIFTPAVHNFLDIIRQGHPKVPLLVITAIHCPIHEQTPGPCAPDLENSDLSTGLIRFRSVGDPGEVAMGKLTLQTIRAELTRIVAQRSTTDPQLHLMDGQLLYGPADYAELPLADELHPGAQAHRRIGERFAEAAFGSAGALANQG